MALQKRLDYGFTGYQLPPTPRAARSVRRRSLFKRKADDNQMCAFDLLATVAGKLLSDGNNSVGKEEKNRSCERDCYERNFLFTEIVSEAPDPNSCSNKLPFSQNDIILRPASGITSSDCSEKISSAEELVNDDCKLSLGISTPSVDIEPSRFRPEHESRKDIQPDSANIRNSSISNKVSLCSSDHSVKIPFCRENVKLVNKDDDDNSSECIEPSTRNKAFKPTGDRRFRKMITSNAKDALGFTDRCNYLNQKNCFKRQRSLRDYPFKKRKLYECDSVSNSDESITANEDGLKTVPSLQGGNMAPNSVGGGYASFHSRNSQVKLRIKSFRVPELFIEIPETATVGSLKCMVMEAVNTVLGGGLRVGVLLQGKKIRDDHKTLVQTGISHDNKVDALGFTLEPNPPSPAPISSFHEDSGQLLCNNPQQVSGYPSTPRIAQNAVKQGNREIHRDHHGSSNNLAETDVSLQRRASESKAIVVVPSMKQDAVGVVPMRKSKRPECTQRRIRRPFTVAEVEALVQAVEKLGTGRWRDVKVRAFDNAKHRTYVDLKDKWKTLVHTAGISAQQRRGGAGATGTAGSGVDGSCVLVAAATEAAAAAAAAASYYLPSSMNNRSG